MDEGGFAGSARRHIGVCRRCADWECLERVVNWEHML
jgi:hypothetical protein